MQSGGRGHYCGFECELGIETMKSGVWAASAAAVALSWAASAQAGVLYSDLDAGDTYNQFIGDVVATSTSTLGADVSRAMQFTATGSGSVGVIDIALSHVTGAGDVDLSLWTDNGGAFDTLLGRGTSSRRPSTPRRTTPSPPSAASPASPSARARPTG